jgi:hypothetical protein
MKENPGGGLRAERALPTYTIGGRHVRVPGLGQSPKNGGDGDRPAAQPSQFSQIAGQRHSKKLRQSCGAERVGDFSFLPRGSFDAARDI